MGIIDVDSRSNHSGVVQEMKYPDEVIRPVAQKIHDYKITMGQHTTPEQDWDDAETELVLHGEYAKPRYQPYKRRKND